MFSWMLELFPNLTGKEEEFVTCIFQTLRMVLYSGSISIVIGIVIGVTLAVTKPGKVLENRLVFNVLDKLINVLRAIPFIILATLLIDFTRLIMGTIIGVKGSIIPLIFGTVPFLSRQIESALAEIDDGVIEAALACGATRLQVVTKVYLTENIPGLIRGITITIVSLIGLTAMMGAVAGGGVGDFAIRYGFQRHYTDLSVLTVIVILIMITIMQTIGNYLIQKTTH